MKDVVCGMETDDEKFGSAYKGKEYFFCSSACKRQFEKNPAKYAKG